MIAGDEKITLHRCKVLNRSHVICQLAHESVSQITSQRNNICIETIGYFHNVFYKTAPDGGAYMNVADLNDPETFKIVRQTNDWNCNLLDFRDLPCFCKTINSED